MLNKLEEALLRRLVEAEKDGQPLTVAQLGSEMRGSTFEDLWACGSIAKKGEEDVMCSQVGPSDAIVATVIGKWKIEAHDAERAGKPQPPSPPPRIVRMFA